MDKAIKAGRAEPLDKKTKKKDTKPVFKKDDYWYVDGFGDVIESNLSWNKDEMRKHIGHLFLFMKGEWQYSDNGIDWEPADEALPMPREVA